MRRIAVWGLGPHAFKNVIPAIIESAALRLIGVCSRSEQHRREAVERWPCTSWADADEMLECPEVDAVYLSTPTGLHFSHGMRVIGSGRHLLCEKSLTAVPAESIILATRAREQGVVLQEAFAFGYHPRFRTIGDIVSGSEFGTPLHAFCCFGLPPLEQPGFRNDPALGGSALLDVGCYPIRAVRSLFGDDITVLHSRISSAAGARTDTRGDASLLIRNTIRADISWGYNQAYVADLYVHGEHQSLCANRVFSKLTLPDSLVTLRDRSGTPHRIDVPDFNAFHGMFDDFVLAMENDVARLRLVDDALGQARLIEELRRCAR